MTIKQLRCGRNHCMALMSIGAILEWGDNEYGQLGNKKRLIKYILVILWLDPLLNSQLLSVNS